MSPVVTFPPRRPGWRAVRRPVGVRTGWAEARTGPYRPYARGRKEKRTAGGRQREGGRGMRMREEKRQLESWWRQTEGGAGVRMARQAQD